jgi:hypothetical protein
MPLIKSSHGYKLIISVSASSCAIAAVANYCACTRLLHRPREPASLAYLMLGKAEQSGRLRRLRARPEFTRATSS